MLKKKTPPTFEERLNTANAEASAALSIFEDIATDLDIATEDKLQIVAEIDLETANLRALIESYDALRLAAQRDADTSAAKAASVRALMGN